MFSNILQTNTTQPADSTVNIAENIGETIGELADMPVKDILALLAENALHIGLKVLAAIVIYSAGAWLIQRVKKLLRKIMTRRNVEASLSSFILSFASITMTGLLLLVTIQTLGVDTSSIVALIAGSGLAIGMALSGTLQNFAGGMMILFFKPFKVGDYIETQGYEGTVHSIQITTTVIKTTDNKTIVLPNGGLSGSIINNYSTSEKRRCDWDISIEYGSDIEMAKNVLLEIVGRHKKVLQEPDKPFVALKSLADSAIIITCRVWVKREDYWDTFYAVNEEIYKELPKRGIGFPYPQMDVHIKNN